MATNYLPSVGTGQINFLPSRQMYGLTGIKQTPDYSGIIRRQASNLPALYALRGSQAQKEKELSLAEQALTQNLDLGKESMALTERLSGEESALTRSLADQESNQRERLARSQMDAEKKQAGKSNLINTASTGVSMGMAGKRLYDWYVKSAEEAAKKALGQKGSGYESPGTTDYTNLGYEAPPTDYTSLGYEASPSTDVLAGPSSNTSSTMAGAVDYSSLGYEAPGAVDYASLGYEAAPASTEAAMGASNAAAFEAGYGAELGSEAAVGTAAGSETAGSLMSIISPYLGAAAAIALPVMGGYASIDSRRQRNHAVEDYVNDMSDDTRLQFILNGPRKGQAWENALNIAKTGLATPERRYDEATNSWMETRPIEGSESYGDTDYSALPTWFNGALQYKGPTGILGRNDRLTALRNPSNYEVNYNDAWTGVRGKGNMYVSQTDRDAIDAYLRSQTAG